MLIINQNHSAVYQDTHIATIYIGADNKSLKCVYLGSSGSGAELAKYDSLDKASSALDLYAQAVGSGAAAFCFPKNADIEPCRRKS